MTTITPIAPRQALKRSGSLDAIIQGIANEFGHMPIIAVSRGIDVASRLHYQGEPVAVIRQKAREAILATPQQERKQA